MIGQSISHYQITEKLGAGGMGVVYKAIDLQLERTVALKFLPHDLALNEADKQRFLREARAASSLDHANIGVIYGIEESEEHQLFIVMAYYEGETLSHKMASGMVPMREALELAMQIACGLAAAHARNIVHRDIKPSNILVTKDNIAKIVDFGLARVVATPSATQSMTVVGTLPYMSPEQILGQGVDQRSDVWALGVILVQMLTASHPFLRESPTAMSFAILNQPPVALDAVHPLLLPIAYRALSKEAAHRYANGKEFFAALEFAKLQLTASGSSQLEDATLTRTTPAGELRRYIERASTPRWPTAQVKKTRNAPIYAAAAVILLAASSLVFAPVRQRLAALLNSGGVKHIAVLPFDNIGNDPANEVLAAGLMDSLTGELSNLSAAQESLWVVPASVVHSRKISDPAAASRDLGANLVVKGSIQREGQDVHLNVDLIDATTLRQIGSVPLEDRAGDMAALQDEAVSGLARLMNIHVTAGMLRATGGNVAPAAYELYLKALGYMERYDKSGNLDQAITSLGSAINADPRFALAYAQLGEAFRLKYQVELNPRWIDEAIANCQKAVQLDDGLASVYVTLGRIHETQGSHDLALQEFRHALTLNRHNSDALSGMARADENAGRLAEAEANFKKATALRPDYWDGYDELALFYDRQGKYTEAIEQLRHAVKLTPDNAQAYSNLGAIYLDAADPKLWPDAEQALRKSVELSPGYPAYANLGSMYYDEKRYAEGAAMFEKALQLNGENYQVWSWLTDSYEWLKEEGKADASREKALALAERQTKLKPQDAMAQAVLASIYAKKNLREKALSRIQTAIALAPDDAEVLEYVAVTYEELGDRTPALQALAKALQKGYSMDKVKNDPAMQALLSDPKFRANGK